MSIKYLLKKKNIKNVENNKSYYILFCNMPVRHFVYEYLYIYVIVFTHFYEY